MNNSTKTIALISFLLLVGFIVFYWYEIRPSNIREECMTKAKQGIAGVDGFDLQGGLARQGIQDAIDGIYSNCLRENGLEE